MAAAGECDYQNAEDGTLLRKDVFAELIGNCGWTAMVMSTAEELQWEARCVDSFECGLKVDDFYNDLGYLATLHMQPWWRNDTGIQVEEIRAAVLRIGMFMGVLKLEKQPLLAHKSTTQPAFAQA